MKDNAFRTTQQNFSLAAISDDELLGLVLSYRAEAQFTSEAAAHLLSRVGGLIGLQSGSKAYQFLSNEQSAHFQVVLELGRRIYAPPMNEPTIIENAADAAQLVTDMASLTQETIRVILLNTDKQVIAVPTVAIGTVNLAVVRVAEVLREAITRNCPALILVHNHPSGDPNPSPEDVELTRTIIAAGKLMDIQLIDHLIIAARGWQSLREMGLAFED